MGKEKSNGVMKMKVLEESDLTQQIKNQSETAAAFNRLYELVKTLRGENGCPWDKEQTPLSLRDALVEEIFEAIDAVTSREPMHCKEELGDCFFNLMLTTYIFEQSQNFSVKDAVNEVCEKIVRRHPHVFGEISEGFCEAKKNLKKEEILSQWDKIKENIEGRKTASVLDSVPKGFPPLLKAGKLLKKAAKTCFEKKDIQEVKNIISKDLDEVSASEKKGDAFQVEEELGDLLFSAVELCRLYNVDANVALENANRKFIKRFKCNETKDRQ